MGMTALENLRAGKALIDTRGWCINHIYNEEGKHCALGLVYYSYDHSGNRENLPALDLLAQSIPVPDAGRIREMAIMKYPWLGEPELTAHVIACYNNEQRDVNVIKAWFDRAIELAEAKQMWEELETAKAVPTVTISKEVKHVECLADTTGH